MISTEVNEQLRPLLDHFARENPGGVIGVYLYGSIAQGNMRSMSDIDLLVVLRRSLTVSERKELISCLLKLSGWTGHAKEFPDAARRRPVEVTAVVRTEGSTHPAAPIIDFQYGEWLRRDFVNGAISSARPDKDLTLLLATAFQAHRVLKGRPLGVALRPPGTSSVRDACIAVLPRVLSEIQGDERNTLLTLARILVTLREGQIVSKDSAAAAIAPLFKPQLTFTDLSTKIDR